MVTLIVLGKLKDKNMQAIESHYTKQLKSLKFNIIELKANAEDNIAEGKKVIEAMESIKNACPILLDELGDTFTTKQFSENLYKQIEQGKHPVYVIGGANGHSNELRERISKKMVSFFSDVSS
jgi:23S rRNA (pseudouridine1915-N3)-methyltransferase